MINPETLSPRLGEFVKHLLPDEHGHRQKAITDIVAALIEQHTGCQADLARAFDNFEAAVKRISRLVHNDRFKAHRAAEAILKQVLGQLPAHELIRLALDWTIEADQHLLVVSLVMGRRAIPIYWRAYEASVLKGRMKRYELSVLKRVLRRVLQCVSARRVIVTADRGFADVELCDLLETFQIEYILRVKCSTKVYFQGRWRQLSQIGFVGNAHHRDLGRIPYCASAPQRLWLTLSRQRNAQGEWEVWYLLSNRKRKAAQRAEEYAYRMGCDEGFRDAKWWLGFADARIKDIQAWSRLFSLCAIAMLAIACLSVTLLLSDKQQAARLLRRITSRRRERCELSWFSAMLLLLAGASVLRHGKIGQRLTAGRSVYPHESPRTAMAHLCREPHGSDRRAEAGRNRRHSTRRAAFWMALPNFCWRTTCCRRSRILATLVSAAVCPCSSLGSGLLYKPLFQLRSLEQIGTVLFRSPYILRQLGFNALQMTAGFYQAPQAQKPFDPEAMAECFAEVKTVQFFEQQQTMLAWLAQQFPGEWRDGLWVLDSIHVSMARGAHTPPLAFKACVLGVYQHRVVWPLV